MVRIVVLFIIYFCCCIYLLNDFLPLLVYLHAKLLICLLIFVYWMVSTLLQKIIIVDGTVTLVDPIVDIWIKLTNQLTWVSPIVDIMLFRSAYRLHGTSARTIQLCYIQQLDSTNIQIWLTSPHITVYQRKIWYKLLHNGWIRVAISNVVWGVAGTVGLHHEKLLSQSVSMVEWWLSPC